MVILGKIYKYKLNFLIMGKTLTGIILAGSLFLSGYAVELGLYYGSGKKFQGSPPKRFVNKRNDLNLYHIGIPWPWNIYKNWAKVTRYQDSRSIDIPFQLNPRKGWLVYQDTVYVEGKIADMWNAMDGDFKILLNLDSAYNSYGSGSKYANGTDHILVEINANIRHNFPILSDLAIDDHTKIKGRFVLDEVHGWNEIHPAYWIDFIEMPAEP